MSAYLSVPSAIEFLNQHKWNEVRDYCHDRIVETRKILLDTSGTDPICSDQDLGQMTSILVDTQEPEKLYRYLKENNIEVPVFNWNGKNLLRVSFQCYNTMDDIHTLNKFLSKYLNGN